MHPDQVRYLRDELNGNRLSVAKLPTARGYVRLAVTQNCEWYRELCGRHLSTRKRFPKPRTVIRRAATLKALDRMERGDFSGVYAARIVEAVKEVYECKHYSTDLLMPLLGSVWTLPGLGRTPHT